MQINQNVIVDSLGAIIVCVLGLSERRNRKNCQDGLFYALMIVILLVFVLDISSWLLDGRDFPGARTVLYLLNTLYWLAQITYCMLWLFFSDGWNYRDRVRLRKRVVFYCIPWLAEVVCILMNVYNGWIFEIDVSNNYLRGRGFLVNMVPYYLYIVAALVLSVRRAATVKGEEQRRRAVSICIYMFLPICGTILETISFGVSWVWPFTALSLLMVHIGRRQEQEAEDRLVAIKLDTELSKLRMSIMMSQIQPHFLYNSLSAIHTLCVRKPALAKEALADFSQYLKANLCSLEEKKPLPFDNELKHIEIYLRLEKMRFGIALNVRYEISCRNFKIPMLTVQPLVENAVKYGIGRKKEGVTVTIGSKEYENCYEVTVTDDGTGYDVDVVPEDGRSHIGIANVKNRLWTMCQATLEITGQPNIGTMAVIRIPKSMVGGAASGL